jgi:hypothetical protein
MDNNKLSLILDEIHLHAHNLALKSESAREEMMDFVYAWHQIRDIVEHASPELADTINQVATELEDVVCDVVTE